MQFPEKFLQFVLFDSEINGEYINRIDIITVYN